MLKNYLIIAIRNSMSEYLPDDQSMKLRENWKMEIPKMNRRKLSTILGKNIYIHNV